MAKKQHSNLLQNPNTHHLYFIYDFENREIYKFGISDKPVNRKYSSERLSGQVVLYNRVVGWKRFSGRILVYPIRGRLQARQLEDSAILKFKEKHKRFPRGNPKHQFLRKKK